MAGTQVSYDGKIGGCLLLSSENMAFALGSYEDGIANFSSFPVVDPAMNNKGMVQAFCEDVAGLFEEGSNFNALLNKEFDCEDELKGIKVLCGLFDFLVTKEDATPEKIYSIWKTELEDYKARIEAETEKLKVKALEAIRIDETTQISFKDEESLREWNDAVLKYREDPIMIVCLSGVRTWIKYMQYLMEKENKVLADVAMEALKICTFRGPANILDTDMLKTLCSTWVHGEELRLWHNSMIGYEGEDVGSPEPSKIVETLSELLKNSGF